MNGEISPLIMHLFTGGSFPRFLMVGPVGWAHFMQSLFFYLRQVHAEYFMAWSSVRNGAIQCWKLSALVPIDFDEYGNGHEAKGRE